MPTEATRRRQLHVRVRIPEFQRVSESPECVQFQSQYQLECRPRASGLLLYDFSVTCLGCLYLDLDVVEIRGKTGTIAKFRMVLANSAGARRSLSQWWRRDSRSSATDAASDRTYPWKMTSCFRSGNRERLGDVVRAAARSLGAMTDKDNGSLKLGKHYKPLEEDGPISKGRRWEESDVSARHVTLFPSSSFYCRLSSKLKYDQIAVTDEQ